MNVQAVILALLSVYGVQQLCSVMQVSSGVTMGLQMAVALILPRFAAKLLSKTLAGQNAPPLENLIYIQGEPVELALGRVNVVEFWATWCPPCKKSIPHLNELYQKYKDQGVGFVSITQESEDVVAEFLQVTVWGGTEQKTPAFTFPCASDPANKIIRAYGVSGIPAAYVIGKENTVFWQGHPGSGLDEAIEKALAAESSTAKKED